ncbi:MAG: hypothetical protein IPJ95_16750 [Gemmatimonadetes bacterium]|nr:hypothetical protein [Gemmatimonadota bacterium]
MDREPGPQDQHHVEEGTTLQPEQPDQQHHQPQLEGRQRHAHGRLLYNCPVDAVGSGSRHPADRRRHNPHFDNGLDTGNPTQKRPGREAMGSRLAKNVPP